MTPKDALAVLGDEELARPAIGQQGQWLNVRTPEKFSGFMAAWLGSRLAFEPDARIIYVL